MQVRDSERSEAGMDEDSSPGRGREEVRLGRGPLVREGRRDPAGAARERASDHVHAERVGCHDSFPASLDRVPPDSERLLADLAFLRTQNEHLRARLRDLGLAEALPPSGDDLETPLRRAMPSASTMASNLLGAASRVAKRALKGGALLASPEETRKRLEICHSNACGRYVEGFAGKGRCAECGCFVPAKARLAAEECPGGLWARENGMRSEVLAEVPPNSQHVAVDRFVPIPEAHAVDVAWSPDVPHDPEDSAMPMSGTHELAGSASSVQEMPPPTSSSVVEPRWGLAVFVRDGCGPCEHAHALLDAVLTKFPPGTVRAIEFELGRQPGIAEEHGVVATPTFLLYENGNFLLRHEGLPTAEVFEVWFSGVADVDAPAQKTADQEGARNP